MFRRTIHKLVVAGLAAASLTTFAIPAQAATDEATASAQGWCEIVPALLFALLITAMAGGLLATGYLVLAARSKSDAHAIPYAPPMAVGVMVSMFANWR